VFGNFIFGGIMPARTNVISLAIILTVLFAGEAPAQYVAPHRPVLRPPVYLPPVQQAPVQRAPVQQAPVQQAPAQQAPAQQQTAQQTQAWDWCKNQGGSVAVDLRVSGCTTVIQSGRENPKNLAFAFNSRGNAYWAKKDYDHAVADYDQAIKLNPTDAVFFSNRGGALVAKGEVDRGITDFDQSIRINPNLPRTYVDRGNAFRGKGLYDRAIADYDQAIKLEPKNAFVFNNRGNVYYTKKDYDRALADFEASIRINPNQPIIFNLRGYVYYAKKDYDRALAEYDQAIKLDPNYAVAFLSRGNSYYVKKEYDRAIADFDQAIRLSPNLARAFNSRGNTYASKGDFERAFADFDQVIRLEPNPVAYAQRCLSRAVLGQLQEALVDCNEAIKLQPSNAQPWGTRGFVNFKLGQFDSAIADYDAALRIDPKRAASLYGRGMAKQRKGDVGAGSADIAAATAIRSDVAELFTRWGEEQAPAVTASIAPGVAATANDAAAPIPAPTIAASSTTATGATAGVAEAAKTVASGDFRHRVALVIGNSNYGAVTPLRNPRNDATDMAAKLRKLGFDVVEGTDVTRRGMDEVIRDFSRKLDGADLALFFYAGHGLQVGGRNYLVPIDAKLERPGDLALDAVDVSVVLAQMEAERRVNIVLLDACRDNPLSRSLARSLGTRSTSVGQGLATIQSAIGTMIAYATQPENVALDGEGRNSPFTTALLKYIDTPGADITTVMRRVRADVIAATKEKQVPWDHSSLTGDVILAQ
jgi:tetratricopeptide (TPR) repeat protein